MKKKIEYTKNTSTNKRLPRYHGIIISGIYIEDYINEIYQLFQLLICNDDTIFLVENDNEFDDKNRIQELLLKNEIYCKKNGYLKYIYYLNLFKLYGYFRINTSKINSDFFQDMLNGFEEMTIFEYPQFCKILEQTSKKDIKVINSLDSYLLRNSYNRATIDISNGHSQIRIKFDSYKINSDDLINRVKKIFKFE